MIEIPGVGSNCHSLFIHGEDVYAGFDDSSVKKISMRVRAWDHLAVCILVVLESGHSGNALHQRAAGALVCTGTGAFRLKVCNDIRRRMARCWWT